MVFYAGLAALAGYLWSLAARSRARRDAFLVHQRLRERIDALEKRLAELEPEPASNASGAGQCEGNSAKPSEG
ncbi:MAG: accessory factor UbiK family protein [Planctomycetaceae bacterium]|nr:accessory factor UbiK family protein [Planctomycetaceae bacterium]